MSEANTINDFYRGYLQGFKDAHNWVGLTDEEIKHIYICTTGWSISDSDPMLVDFAIAIEAKLKAKNERLEKNK